MITLLLVLGTVVFLAGLLLLGGFLYQSIGDLIDRKRLLSHGSVVDIGDRRRLYLVEKGPADRGPSVVFESGFGATSLNWIHIQDAVALHVHTVAYDRCGLGWSSASVSERTPSRIAAELHAMLRTAGVRPPYVLVGHSFGGLVMQRFALDYPDDTAGLVLLDPMRTHEWPPINQDRCATVARAQRLTGHGMHIARFGMARLAARSHLCRSAKLSGFLIRLAGAQGAYLAGRLDTEIGKMPPGVRPAIAAHWSAPRFYRGLLAHLSAVRATVAEMHDVEPIRDTPVLVITPGSSTPVDDMDKYGPLSREIIAERSQHWIHLDEPDLVVRAILDMVADPARHFQERTLAIGD
ncbi:MAG: alpha/beta hydrolase [Acidobacteriaceae bacterium]|jgi:pimeloyl-ACP methyl ester carboxylesterase